MSAWRRRTTLKAITTGKHSQQLCSIKYSVSPGLKQTTEGNIVLDVIWKRKKQNTSWLALITVVETEIERFLEVATVA